MSRLPRAFLPLLGVFGLLAPLSDAAAQKPGQFRARWIGQDGHDYVGMSSELKPSDVQDIHLELADLPLNREIAKFRVRGYGGDEWNNTGAWRAELVRKPGSTRADVYMEPTRPETGRSFNIEITYKDGAVADINIPGGKADPSRRMPDATLALKWAGQSRTDLVGPGPSVGPDGIQDTRITLTKLSKGFQVREAKLEGPGKLRWLSGMNPEGAPNAELVRDPKDPSRAELFFQPDRDLAGQTLKLTITYETGRTDKASVKAAHIDPKLAMPRQPLPRILTTKLQAKWIGQDGKGPQPGDVHIQVTGLPANAKGPLEIVALSDSIQGLWIARLTDHAKKDDYPSGGRLSVRRGDAPNSADLFFDPYRDETGTPVTLRVSYAGGDIAYTQFPGGACDVGQRIQGIAPTTATAKPGDDLAKLVNNFGTVRLSKGTYRLPQPLVLNRPVTLKGEPGAVLLFDQDPSSPPWTTAIKIHEGHTTLEGFAVRFAGPIRWNTQVGYGPAVIGATDGFDPGGHGLKIGLLFRGLDLDSPPSAKPESWEEAPRLMRLTGAQSGTISGNILRGGVIEFFGGPWKIVDNESRGTPPGTISYSTVTGHYTVDLLLKGNRVEPVRPGGKTWRFLVITGRGIGDRIEDNTIVGVGPRDDDTIPWSNNPETILTESYRLNYEGKPTEISADRRVVRVATLQGPPPGTGDVVAVLAGAGAGQWRKIAQPIDRTTYLLDAPLPEGTDVVSVSGGFVDELFKGNTIDDRGGQRALNLVLAGNQFGTKVIGNRLLGASQVLRMTSTPSEQPVFWGWTHSPFFGAVFDGNVIEDSERGGLICVEHALVVKTAMGRTYMTVDVRNNVIRWSETFLAARAAKGAKNLPSGLTIGQQPSLDPADLVVNARDNHLQAPSTTAGDRSLVVEAALLNGQAVVKKTFALPSDSLRSRSTERVGTQPTSRPR